MIIPIRKWNIKGRLRITDSLCHINLGNSDNQIIANPFTNNIAGIFTS